MNIEEFLTGGSKRHSSGARYLRIQFDAKCHTEPKMDVLTLMDGHNNTIEQLSGRRYKDWNGEVFVMGDTVKWR